MSETIDLSLAHRKFILEVLDKHFPLKKVYVFGSRIEKQNTKKFSDLDLAIENLSDHDSKTLALLRYDFEDSNLPFRVDVVDLNTVDDDFKRLILEDAVVLK